MASLTRGVSFRRQGSSGLSWADTWSFNEEGVLMRMTKEEAAITMGGVCGSGSHGRSFGGLSLSRIHDLQDDDENVGGGGAAGGEWDGDGDGRDDGCESGVRSFCNRDCDEGTAKARGHDCEEGDKGIVSDRCTTTVPVGSFGRSRSMGNAISITSVHCCHSKLPLLPPPAPRTKPASRLIRWIRKTFAKSKKPAHHPSAPAPPLEPPPPPTSHLESWKPPKK